MNRKAQTDADMEYVEQSRHSENRQLLAKYISDSMDKEDIIAWMIQMMEDDEVEAQLDTFLDLEEGSLVEPTEGMKISKKQAGYRDVNIPADWHQQWLEPTLDAMNEAFDVLTFLSGELQMTEGNLTDRDKSLGVEDVILDLHAKADELHQEITQAFDFLDVSPEHTGVEASLRKEAVAYTPGMNHLESAINQLAQAKTQVWVWDKVGVEWVNFDLPLPPNAGAFEISMEIDRIISEEPDLEEPWWDVKGEQKIGKSRVICARSGRGHLSLIVVGAKSEKEAEAAVKKSKWAKEYEGYYEESSESEEVESFENMYVLWVEVVINEEDWDEAQKIVDEIKGSLIGVGLPNYKEFEEMASGFEEKGYMITYDSEHPAPVTDNERRKIETVLSKFDLISYEITDHKYSV